MAYYEEPPLEPDTDQATALAEYLAHDNHEDEEPEE